MADLIDFVNRKCLLHMCKNGKVVSNKVRVLQFEDKIGILL